MPLELSNRPQIDHSFVDLAMEVMQMPSQTAQSQQPTADGPRPTVAKLAAIVEAAYILDAVRR